MTETTHLGLPYLAAAQAQKHVTHNEALSRLDAVVQLAVIDTALTAAPGSPDEGDRYIVAAGATGVWTGHEGEIAAFVDGAWIFVAAGPGWIAFDAATESVLVRHDGDWVAIGSFLGAVDRFGVNATADATNRLAVRSNAVLFTGVEAAEGGTGDVRFVVTKEADGDTASLLFQSGFSGRAEVGLAGDTDFVFKVSADGSAWIESIRIDKDTGLATILYDNAISGLAATTVQEAIDEVAVSGGGGAVASVFGRTGTVVAATSDYDAVQVDFTPAGAIASTNVQAAIAELDTEKLGKAGGTMSGFITLHADPDAAMKAATKQYVDGIVAAQDAMVFKGVVDCSANPNYPAADRGWTYRVSVAGKIGGGSGANVEAGDLLLCLTDGTSAGNQATVGSAWSIAQTNLDGAVIGPASATDSHLAQFDGASGKLLKGGKAAPSGVVVGTTDAQTLTNKTLTAPAISSPTGLVKGDVGLGSVTNNAQVVDPGGNGIVARTASGSASARTITGTTNEIEVANGDGVSGNPTISLPADVSGATLNKTGYAGSQTVGLYFGNAASGVQAWSSYGTATSTRNHMIFENANGTVGSISTNGSSTSFNISSSRRLKEDIRPADAVAALVRLVALPIRDFAWRVDGAPGRGVIADEAAATHPEAVSGGPDDMTEEWVASDGKRTTYLDMPTTERDIAAGKQLDIAEALREIGKDPEAFDWHRIGQRPRHEQVDYTKFIPDLILAVQQLAADNAALTGDNRSLAARIEALEAAAGIAGMPA